jgi:hypothetical protein
MIEAGMALVTHPDRTILVVLGNQELPSDLAGRHYIRLSHTTPAPLNDLAQRLRRAGCDTNVTGSHWLKPERFPNRDHLPQRPAITREPPTALEPNPAPAAQQATSAAASATRRGKTTSRKTSLKTRQLDRSKPPSLPPVRHELESTSPELAIRGRLLLPNSGSRTRHIDEPARSAALHLLDGEEGPLTGSDTTIYGLMCHWCPAGWVYDPWQLDGQASTREFGASWRGRTKTGRLLVEAKLNIELSSTAADHDDLTVTLHTLLANPDRPNTSETLALMAQERGVSPDFGLSALLEDKNPASPLSPPPPTPRSWREDPPPILDLPLLGHAIEDILSSLWGALAETLSTRILDQSLAPPAELDLAIFTISPGNYHDARDGQPKAKLNKSVDFGRAQLIPGAAPHAYTLLDSIHPDTGPFSSTRKQEIVRAWLTQFCLDNSYQNFEEELTGYALTT